MSTIQISGSSLSANFSIELTGSKSETNRLLLLAALYPNLTLLNDSNAHDVSVMKKALQLSSGTVDIHHAGTAMRFLTAYFSVTENAEVLLTGSDRMKQRPIALLVDALRALGATIEYRGEEGYPPLHIKGAVLPHSSVSIAANVSSQYLSALCLVGAKLPEGLEIELVGSITSLPYLNMTLQLLERIGISARLDDRRIRISPKSEIEPISLAVESDWSAASYYYSIIALSKLGTKATLSTLREDSLQGDRVLSTIYKDFGVSTRFDDGKVVLEKVSEPLSQTLSYDLKDAPDIAQTIAVTAAGLQVDCYLTGLHTLPIKETDRLAAMKCELEKVGADVEIDTESLRVLGHNAKLQSASIATYNDHRMAMAFAPLAILIPLTIEESFVVEKSYPDFWKHLSSIGYQIS
ncbi:MAG: 3-phosphoshikimate 1-carboxyvinyltransferase [Flavobacteriaceae bacterium]